MSSGFVDYASMIGQGLTPLESSLGYGARLSKSMRERIEAQRARALQLDEELALMRVICEDAVVAYDNAMQAAEKLEDTTKRLPILGAASAMLVQAVRNVQDTALAAHRIKTGLTLSPEAIGQIVYQVVRVFNTKLESISNVLEAGGIDVQQFIDEITNTVDGKLVNGTSSSSALGVDFTPEDLSREVQAMHDTVPLAKEAS